MKETVKTLAIRDGLRLINNVFSKKWGLVFLIASLVASCKFYRPFGISQGEAFFGVLDEGFDIF